MIATTYMILLLNLNYGTITAHSDVRYPTDAACQTVLAKVVKAAPNDKAYERFCSPVVK